MAFAKVDTQVDFPAQEREVLQFWQRHQTFEKLRQQNCGKPKWSFLDGPITANNPMGVHHAWGRTYKDAYQRYFAMTGHELRYQNGFDCQGLWVEVEVEKELKLQSKRDIENLVPGDPFASIDKFVNECKARVNRFAKVQTEQSIRLGYWMDWDRDEDWAKPPDQRRSYYTMSEENNYTIWAFLKKCHDRKLIYRGYDAMPWCPRCAVGLSQMEMHEGYQMVAHRAVFVRFPLRDAPNESLLIWTTTPWTLTSNVAAAVHPERTYIKVEHRDQIYYVAKGAFTFQRLEEQFKRKEWIEGVPKLKTLEQIFKEKGGYKVLGELPGSALVGRAYDGPFDELPAQQHPGGYPETVAENRRIAWDIHAEARGDGFGMGDDAYGKGDAFGGGGQPPSSKEIHRVVAWNAVGETEGTGIVHIAPGCGKEDFQLGKDQALVAVAPLDDYGNFVAGFGELAGKSAVDPATTDWILDNLQKKGVLVAVEKYPHSYPHCWRCKTELLFRLVDEWFIDMKWRNEIKEVVKKVAFLPESINGQAREQDWLTNMGDWMISKKRFWGLALPIWLCDACGHFDVIGSRAELKERAGGGWDKFEGKPPHRPWVDLIKIKCGKCGSESARVSDVGNPWLDAGIVPFSTMGYNKDRAYWEKWFPADFITECFPGQFRNWFYAILAMSTMMENRAPFKVLLGHGLVRDQDGDEMHKAKGNSIPFEGAADVGYQVRDKKTGKMIDCPPMSADLIRWLYCRHNPAANINFGPGPAEELRSKLVMKLWNSYAFFCNYAGFAPAQGGFDVAAPPVPVKDRPDIDRWILSDLQLLIQKAHEAFQSFNVMAFALEAERFVDEKMSNWYIRRNRRRFWKSEAGQDKQAAYQTLHTVLLTLTKLFAPIMPFLTEVMYRNLASGGREPPVAPESVHLCEFPKADPALINETLSKDMEALLRLVSLGSAARNTVKIKVRQPLAEMRVLPADDVEKRAVNRFADQVREELNIKKVSLHDPAKGRLLMQEVKPNMKTLGPQLGFQLTEVVKALKALDPAETAKKKQNGENLEVLTSNGFVMIAPGDVDMSMTPPKDWAGVFDRGTEVLIDTRITEELKREGMVREVTRQVQNARKEAGLQMDDRIILYLATESAALNQAIQAFKDFIMAETLTADWATAPLGDGAYQADVKVDGQPLHIELRKIG